MKLKTKRSSAGLGLYTEEPIAKGQTVIEYIGNKVRTTSDIENRYIFNVNTRWDIDGSPRWNTARYINHSCRSNCEAIDRRGRIFIVAKKNIQAGEELTYHYGKDYITSDYFKGGCRCAKCQGK
ncbi:MAG: SET domain-containing protein-lysine N-methyltransferase [Candidatus Moraniibacteriota bacterium]